MDGHSFHVDDLQTVTRKQLQQRGQEEIENVLVINGVEFPLGKKFRGVREFQHDAPAWREQRLQAADEIVDLRRMGEDVVSKD